MHSQFQFLNFVETCFMAQHMSNFDCASHTLESYLCPSVCGAVFYLSIRLNLHFVVLKYFIFLLIGGAAFLVDC